MTAEPQKNRLLNICLSLSLLFAASYNKSRAQEFGGASPRQQAREQSANKIIKDSEEYKAWAKKFIAQSNHDIKEAHKLTGEAKHYQAKFTPKYTKLRGSQLAEAKKQFQVDLRQFSQHAQQYKSHTERVRQQSGQCQTSLKAYERNRNDYSLHCKAFHLPDVAPPHVCLAMDTSVEEAASAQKQMQENLRRMAAAENELVENEKKLGKALAESADVNADVRKQHELNLKEQALVAEFGKLKEEYRLLDVERKALQLNGVRVGVPSVHAKVKK